MRNSAGQALVLVLLSLAVVLTLVLFILSRTVTDISVSTNEEEAIRAFSAAEAGVEQALVVASDVSNPNLGDASFSAKVTGFAEGGRNFNYPLNLSSGDSATVWFAKHLDDGTLVPSFTGTTMKVCWGRVGTSDNNAFTPALEISVFYNDSTVKIGRVALDPYSGRTSTNKFTAVSGRNCTIDGIDYEFWTNVNLNTLTGGATDGLLFAKVRMLYNSDQNQTLGVVVNGGNLPSQGLDISSIGSAGESNRRIHVFQSWPEVPSIFDYAIFSGSTGGLTKP